MTVAVVVGQRRRGRLVLALVFALLAIGAAWQMCAILLNHSDPRALAAFQAAIATSATATAVGSWSMSRWAPIAALLYGAVTASMLLALAPLLQLDPAAAGGLRIGATIVAVFALWAAWFLRPRSGKRAATERQPK